MPTELEHAKKLAEARDEIADVLTKYDAERERREAAEQEIAKAHATGRAWKHQLEAALTKLTELREVIAELARENREAYLHGMAKGQEVEAKQWSVEGERDGLKYYLAIAEQEVTRHAEAIKAMHPGGVSPPHLLGHFADVCAGCALYGG